ncbi:FAD-dependent oxidoreductase [Acuticoccus sp. I52.16.1]|uniref:FAD-dependent oxidoreductase n=1 Tax=Acuticoccus sp. I52.16.1 TaxID=2928472 RepID=UPI001FD55C0A|nr:FAD-dependent oxidoreductase [Acuticoccus sp. I52.16.1]UOM37240.1 FAD-dependent oxidoreductase [Acuticoccus sp. I52.16.1]
MAAPGAVAVPAGQGGKLNPIGYVRGLAEAAAGAGARLTRATPALSLERAGSGWRIVTPGGTVTADAVVLATNGYTDDLLPPLRRTVVPVHTAIAATALLPAEVAATILPDGSVLYETGRVTVYYRLDAERWATTAAASRWRPPWAASSPISSAACHRPRRRSRCAR